MFLAVLVAIGFNVTGSVLGEGKYDSFAKCLSANGVKMYGAYWCPHCDSQKQMFGSSWKYVDYIECAVPGSNAQNTACSQAGVRAYPTWVFPDGKKMEGELSFGQLSQYSNCKLEK